jgi:hypothetical protein
MGGSWRRRMGESWGKTGAPAIFYEKLNLLTWSLQISTPCALAYFTATSPLPAVPISHPTHTPCIHSRSNFTSTTGGTQERAGPPQNYPPLRARLLHGRQLSLSRFHLTSHTPCTRCMLNFIGTTGGARERAGSPQNRPPPALTLASRPPTLS